MATVFGMNLVDRVGAPAAAGVAGFAALASNMAARPYDATFSEVSGTWFAQFVTAQWAGTITVVVAIVVLVRAHLRPSTAWAVVTCIVGALLICSPAVVPLIAGQAVSVNAVGAGLLLASAAIVASTRRSARLSLMAGVLGATLFADAIRVHVPLEEGRWISTLDPTRVDPAVHPALLLIVVALVVTALVRTRPTPETPTAQSIVVLIALPFAYLLTYVYLGSLASSTPMWVLASVVACGFTVVASRLLAPSDGNAVLFGFAVAAAGVTALAWSSRSWWVAGLGAAIFVGGVIVGDRRPRPKVAYVLLATIVVSGLLTGAASLGIIPTVAYAVVLPAAVGFGVGTCVPEGATAALFGSSVPSMMTLFSVAAPAPEPSLYWSDGVDDAYRFPIVTAVTPSYIAVIVALVAVVIAGVAWSPKRVLP